MIRYLTLIALLVLFTPSAWAAEGAPAAHPVSEATSDLGALVETEALGDHNPDHEGLSQSRRVRRRRRVYRRRYSRPAHRTRVVVVRDQPPAQRVYARPRQRVGMSAGVRLSLLSLSDTRLAYDTFEGATLAGLGFYLRGRIAPFIGVELSTDLLGAEEVGYQQLTIPVMASLMVHIFPDSPVDVYGLGGLGLHFSAFEHYTGDGRTYDEAYTQFAGQLGAGLEFNFGGFQLTTEMRWLFMESRPEESAFSKTVTPVDVDIATTPEGSDDVTHALQFMVGLGGNF